VGSGIPKLRWQGAGEKGKIMQHCAIFCNRKNAKRREPTNTGQEPGIKGMGSGRFKPPLSPPPVKQCMKRNTSGAGFAKPS